MESLVQKVFEKSFEKEEPAPPEQPAPQAKVVRAAASCEQEGYS